MMTNKKECCEMQFDSAGDNKVLERQNGKLTASIADAQREHCHFEDP